MLHKVWEALICVFHLLGRWDGVTAISTAAAAIFTAWMAHLTRKAIKDGQDQRAETNRHFEETRIQDKRHHEDTFRPFLVLAQTDVQDIYFRGGTVTHYSVTSVSGVISIKCLVRNIGNGPALNVKLLIYSAGKVGFGPTRELLPIAAGDEYSDAGSVEVLVYFSEDFNSQDLVNLTNGLWVMELQYEDIFGTAFRTLHCKDSSQPWTRAAAIS